MRVTDQVLNGPWTVEFLTDEDNAVLDPYGLNRKSLKRFDVDHQITGPKSSLMPKSGLYYLEQWTNIMDSNPQLFTKASSYYQWNKDYVEKFGPQGGVFPISVVLDSYQQSYENAKHQFSSKYAVIGAKWLAQLIRRNITRLDVDILQYADCKQVIDTNGAIPVGMKKGTFLTETIGFKAWRHMYPNLPGERYMRKKMRTINQDACANVRYTESILSACRNYLKNTFPCFFGSWLNPVLHVNKVATKIVDFNMYSVETDYSRMDEHFTREFTTSVVLPVYDALLERHPGQYWRVAQLVDEMFQQPIYFGNFMLTGVHCLLSGQNPTNDFETIGQVCQSVGILLCMGFEPTTVLQLHLGDDQVVAFKNKADAELFMQLFIEESNNNGLLINEEKSAIRHAECQYCRKLYYKNGRRQLVDGEYQLIGAYPTLLSLNSIINPERIAKTDSIEAISTYQRLDNCYGSPDFYLLCQFIAKMSNLSTIDIDEEDIALVTDWWYKLYGEKWNPLSSPSFKFINNIK